MPTPRRYIRRSGGASDRTAGRCWRCRSVENRSPEETQTYRFFPPDPPVVHLLAAATGIEEHTVPGLTSPKVADLTGDGLADLWGAVDGKLVAIRAEPAEAWRALDGLHAAGDFDGDGMSDLLSNDFEAPPIWPVRPMDRQTALARSGRDGRMLWRTQLDAWEKPGSRARRTGAIASWLWHLPGGDLDGDGVADFVVSKSVAPPPRKDRRHAAAGGALGPHGQVALVGSDFADGGREALPGGTSKESMPARAIPAARPMYS